MSEPSDAISVRPASPAEIIELLTGGRFGELIGVIEAPEVDFKRFYDLAKQKGQRGLIEDRGALANTSGGVLVVGAETARHPTEKTEHCSAIVDVPTGSITAERVLKLGP